MLFQTQSKSNFAIKALAVVGLAVGILLHSLDAHGMGHGERIIGHLESTDYGRNVGGCFNLAVSRTGLGVEAMSYAGGHLRCDMFHSVDSLQTIGGWCSTWVVQNAPNECAVDPPPPAPSAPGFTIEWQHCQGLTAVYALDWWVDSETIGPVTYKLEQRVNGIWLPAYEGSSTHFTFGCPGNTRFRVKATNEGGSSEWTERLANHDCGEGGLPD